MWRSEVNSGSGLSSSLVWIPGTQLSLSAQHQVLPAESSHSPIEFWFFSGHSCKLILQPESQALEDPRGALTCWSQLFGEAHVLPKIRNSSLGTNQIPEDEEHTEEHKALE